MNQTYVVLELRDVFENVGLILFTIKLRELIYKSQSETRFLM